MFRGRPGTTARRIILTDVSSLSTFPNCRPAQYAAASDHHVRASAPGNVLFRAL